MPGCHRRVQLRSRLEARIFLVTHCWGRVCGSDTALVSSAPDFAVMHSSTELTSDRSQVTCNGPMKLVSAMLDLSFSALVFQLLPAIPIS